MGTFGLTSKEETWWCFLSARGDFAVLEGSCKIFRSGDLGRELKSQLGICCKT